MDNLVDIVNNKLSFNNKNVLIVLDKENNPWFKAKDICNILEYEKSRNAILNHVDYEDKVAFSNFLKGPEMGLLENIHPHTVFINESGVYSLIFSSKMKQAKLFKNWVTREVLPAIRKCGEYKLQKEKDLLCIEFEEK